MKYSQIDLLKFYKVHKTLLPHIFFIVVFNQIFVAFVNPNQNFVIKDIPVRCLDVSNMSNKYLFFSLTNHSDMFRYKNQCIIIQFVSSSVGYRQLVTPGINYNYQATINLSTIDH